MSHCAVTDTQLLAPIAWVSDEAATHDFCDDSVTTLELPECLLLAENCSGGDAVRPKAAGPATREPDVHRDQREVFGYWITSSARANSDRGVATSPSRCRPRLGSSVRCDTPAVLH